MDQPEYERPPPAETVLRSELDGVVVTGDEMSEPICARCESLGEASDELVLREGTPVYVCAYWTEWHGWELLGVYHRRHDRSRIAGQNPTRPVVILRGTLERCVGIGTDESEADAYDLTDLSVVTVTYPRPLDF